MQHVTRSSQRGFTLIELMVVIVIIGILAVLGLVSYQNAIRKARNTQAIGNLKDYAAAQEQNKALTNTYVGTCTQGLTVGDYVVPSGTAYSCSFNSSPPAFCIAAALESQTGNCSGCLNNGVMNTTVPLDSFCIVSKQ